MLVPSYNGYGMPGSVAPGNALRTCPTAAPSDPRSRRRRSAPLPGLRRVYSARTSRRSDRVCSLEGVDSGSRLGLAWRSTCWLQRCPWGSLRAIGTQMSSY